MYQFGGGGGGGDSYRPGDRSDLAPRNSDRRDDFTFRAGDQDLRFPPADAHRASRDRNRRPQARDRRQRQPGRGPWRPPAPHERAILRSNREKTPEQLEGMGEGKVKFISLSDISDSEAEMDLESGNEGASDAEHPPAKKAKAATSGAANDGDARPKWSNPDPYTALPPPDETQAKKRDVVKLIRKAKVAAEQEASSNAVTNNEDFISLNFDDEDEQESDGDAESGSDNGARPGARSFSLSGLPPRPPTNSLDVWPPPPPQPPTGPRGMKRTRGEDDDDDDDDLESLPPPPPKGKKRKREVIDGRIVEDWHPRTDSSPTPWCAIDHSATQSMGFWLHKEIADFYEFVRPHPFENEIRLDLVHRIEQVTRREFPGSELHYFGSFAAGLYLPTADMDLVLLSKHFIRTGRGNVTKKNLYKMSTLLEREGISQPGATEVISGARVPIIKIVDRKTGLKVDISFENNTGIIANRTFREWKEMYPAMPVIATLIKQYLAMRGLNEVFTGGLGGFSVICLVVSLLHNWPARQSHNLDPRQHYGDVLLNFFDLYGNKFNINTTRISLNPHGLVAKGVMDLNGKPTKADRLSIIDPNTPNNDISSGSHNVVLIQRCFSEAFTQLRRRMAELNALSIPERRHESILKVLFAGNYTSFDWQRRRLRKIYEKS
ncbi:hypothetical protein B0J12DRAFT_576447 [Macrophomina phaseolina]|uniref:polynucleotide adenylyltransferase n=1 Tax=Macrophomina phaseolina TaxID=35725 RepID=A0ABQ8G8Q7_9PEZI|nr:hypothetical protein B0J12DRAFT_576447 [Macrophomina phaseolina]